jgi:peptidoglycan/LPS O-acetylase OafA/YrhL
LHLPKTIAVDTIKPTKQHFEVLDGLRGTAALLVVLFHYTEYMYPNYEVSPLGHAYLAVDFFFLLSGFVIGYAYDSRWGSMKVKDFFCIRLIRLHPLVVLAVVLGVFSFLFDPFAQDVQRVSAARLAFTAVMCCLMIPSPTLPNRYEEINSLNGPSWSLFQEYLANILYAFIGPRIGITMLKILVALAAIGLIITAKIDGRLVGGWGWSNLWIGFARSTFAFFAGLLLFRLNLRIKIPWAYTILSVVLLAIFAAPTYSFNGWYESFAVIVIFPIIVTAGAGSSITGFAKRICDFAGRISYPIYILHYPFVYIFGHWYVTQKPSSSTAALVIVALTVFLIGFAWLALTFYDEPVRKWLQARTKKKAQASIV